MTQQASRPAFPLGKDKHSRSAKTSIPVQQRQAFPLGKDKHPHFLFNKTNAIFFPIHKDRNMASASLEENSDPNSFIRVHKSYIVSIRSC